MRDSSIQLRTFKYRLYPSKSQEKNLGRVLNACRGLYNMALAERKYAYQLEGRTVKKSELYELAKHYRQTFPYADQVFSQTAQSVIDQVELAFEAFFRRVKAGEKPGYPRFKNVVHFNSFLFKQYGSGATIDGRRLKLFGIGRVAVRWHRPLEGKVKTVRIVQQAGRWFACFACEVEVPDLPFATGRSVGLDLGISAMLTTSDGEKVDNPAYYRLGQKRLRLLQRKLARAQRGSLNRRKVLRQVQRQQAHVANQRADFLHKLTRDLVETYDRIASEDLHITNIVRNHHLFPDFDLSVRWVECDCGLSLDRDHNAAINMLNRAGWDTPVPLNEAPLPAPNGKGKRKRAVEAARLEPSQSVTARPDFEVPTSGGSAR